MADAFLTPPAYARRLGIKPSKVIGWITRGELKAVNVSDGARPLWRIPIDEITAFEARRSAVAPSKASARRRRKREGVIAFYT